MLSFRPFSQIHICGFVCLAFRRHLTSPAIKLLFISTESSVLELQLDMMTTATAKLILCTNSLSCSVQTILHYCVELPSVLSMFPPFCMHALSSTWVLSSKVTSDRPIFVDYFTESSFLTTLPSSSDSYSDFLVCNRNHSWFYFVNNKLWQSFKVIASVYFAVWAGIVILT